MLVDALTGLVPGGVAGGELRRDGRALRWVEAGSGRPAVVLEAGSSDTALAWAPILGSLAERTHAVAYDRAGLGASDPPDVSPPTVEDRLADLAALIGQVTDGPCVVVGHSWGGILAQMLAFDHPELVAGVVLVDPGHEEMLDGLPRWQRRIFTLVNDHVIDPLPSWLQAVRLHGRVERRLALRRSRGLTPDPEARARLAAAYVARRESPAQLRGIREERRGIVASVPGIRRRRETGAWPDVPVTVLSATRGAPRRVRAHWTGLQAALAGAAPRGTHTIVEGAGHTIQRDRPDAVIDAILRTAGRRNP